MTSRAEPVSKVGIFWVMGGKLILATTPVSQAEPYAEAKGHPRGHFEHWTILQRRGAMSADIEYDDPPRGRVVYFPKDEQFTLYADRCILSRKHFLRQIIAEMSLPAKRTKTSSDEHYRCLRCRRD
jgi:hypothetical protein